MAPVYQRLDELHHRRNIACGARLACWSSNVERIGDCLEFRFHSLSKRPPLFARFERFLENLVVNIGDVSN
jgi:hypothetical protein